ncbi:MAG: NADP-dependent oxidoreductase [Rhodospirillaceae bacterium]|nr:NADP-dependent oxidoreductase [Rhodospirillaceae bacterium]
MIDTPKTNLQWLLADRPIDRAVRESDFKLHEAPIPEPKEGEFVIRVIYSSLAPVMRFYMLDGAGIEEPLEIGDVMRGRGVGQVVTSKNPDYMPGDIVHGKMGWQQYAVADGSPYYLMYKVSQREVPVSTALGVLGMTGFTAYFGLFDIGKPVAGETVLVSGAAGGVGSNVGQIAKIRGCKTIGIAGSKEKCELLVDSLGYDAAINYRDGDIGAQMDATCPDGIDVFFDNVGGEILDEGLARINKYARIVACGQISQYIGDGSPRPIKNAYKIGRLNALMQGFLIYDYAPRLAEAESGMVQWIREGRLTYQEDILDGIERMPEALIRLYDSKNKGKQLVQVSPDPF